MVPPTPPAEVEPRSAENPAETMLLRGAMLGDLQSVKQALADGANVEAKGDSDNTALSAAAMRGDPAIVAALLEAGADVNSEDVTRSTPLMAAASQGHVEAARLLFEQIHVPRL